MKNVLVRSAGRILLVQIKLNKSSFKVPSKNRAIMSTREDQVVFIVVCCSHNVITVGLLSRVVCKILVWQVTTGSHIFFVTLPIIRPNSESFVPASSDEERGLFSFFFLGGIVFIFFAILNFVILIFHYIWLDESWMRLAHTEQ